MKTIIHKRLNNKDKLRNQLLNLSNSYSMFSILDSNNWPHDKHKTYDLLAAFGSANEITTRDGQNSFDYLRSKFQKKPNWLFGYLSYDLKNEIENLESNNQDSIQAPKMHFFTPKILILLQGDILDIKVHQDYLNDQSINNQINQLFESANKLIIPSHSKVEIKHRISQQKYLETISHIQQHIKEGDIYELNYCQEFYAQDIQINPQGVFKKLIEKSPTPFAAFMRFDDIYTMSTSPERYIKKLGGKIISQPIKGTARRKKEPIKDQMAMEQLESDQKERAENIMIVDLVRNDLAHTAKKNSVKVEELCKIYSFEQVHQMISTISSDMDNQYDFVDVLKTTFPMGSMTGAPKISAMKLIEQYEHTKRGIYSGAIGYITPEGDFDFNVVIRSLIYNQKNKYLSFIAGGAITYQSNPEKEYAESLLKAEAIRAVLS